MMRVWNSFDPDQARHFVGTNLGHNCLQKLSAETLGDKELAFYLLVAAFVFWLAHAMVT